MIYKYTDYKKIIRYKTKEQQITFTALAEKCRMQKSFLSMVLNQEMHLSEEQAFYVAEVFGFNRDETEYFLLLLQLARASTAKFSPYIKSKIHQIRHEKQKLKDRLSPKTIKLNESNHIAYYDYYLNPLVQSIHMLLVIPKYQTSLQAIADRFSTTCEAVEKALSTLQKLGVVVHQAGRYESIIKSVHCDNGSQLSEQNHINARLQALQKKFLLAQHDYRFSAMISTDNTVKQKIVEEIKDMLSRCQALMQDSSPRDLYQLNIDLFQR